MRDMRHANVIKNWVDRICSVDDKNKALKEIKTLKKLVNDWEKDINNDKA